MTTSPRFVAPLYAEVWANGSTGAATNSATCNTYSSPFVTAFGNVSAATTITLMLSADGTNWYAGPTVVLTGAGNFYLNATVGAQYVALQSSNSVTATAVISAK